jgi:hypothetical protein
MSDYPRPRIAVIGAGVAGAIASGATSTYSPTVFDSSVKKPSLASHRAVMRIRKPETALLLGCQLEKIVVDKAVYFEGKLHTEATLQMNNLYSLKTTGEICDRSISDLGRCERYLVTSDIYPRCKVEWNRRLTDVHNRTESGRELEFIERNDPEEDGHFYERYDFCISTIPLPSLIKILGMKREIVFKFKTVQIGVRRAKIRESSHVHQTIYFPSPDFMTYRATLQNDEIILESRAARHDGWGTALTLFGLSKASVIEDTITETKQIGKMTSIPEADRKSILYEITDRFNIFSFGRYAIWKPVRIDNLVDDIEKIKKMILVSETSRSYEIAKERAQ